ncbi:PTS sugar transporter subunit IIA [Orbus mooreae]|uniref:PTS sugar transporter subunit IIA n=1 Tax=Orbus mooreae TaxID=3074107 RepID=UPI00370D569D
MIGVLLVSHGKMAEGIKDSVGMIVGDAKQFDTLSLVPGQDIATLSSDILVKSKELNAGEGVLIFVDLFGASPYNASMKCLPEWNALNIPVSIVSGMSLPMVITAVCNRDFSSLDELTKDVISAGVENMKDALAELNAANNSAGDGDDY